MEIKGEELNELIKKVAYLLDQQEVPQLNYIAMNGKLYKVDWKLDKAHLTEIEWKR